MTTRVRSKWMCSGKDGNVVKFHTVYSDDVQSEDGRFTKATPWGDMTMAVDNPDAAIQFEPGKSYYVDFTPVD